MKKIRSMNYTVYDNFSYLVIGRGNPGEVGTYWDANSTTGANRAARLRQMFQAWMVKTQPGASLVDVYTVNMMEAKYSGDREIAHIEADNLLCELLRELGYGAVVDEYEKIDKWYA